MKCKTFLSIAFALFMGFLGGRYHYLTNVKSLDYYTPKVFFSPDNKPKNHLIEMIQNEQKRILCAVYIFTDHDIADAMVKAKKRDVDIKLIVDQSCLGKKGNQVNYLRENGISVDIYTARRYIMHNKFILFEENMDGRKFIWTGSFNLTYAANNNQENSIALENDEVYKQYEDQFTVIQRIIANQ